MTTENLVIKLAEFRNPADNFYRIEGGDDNVRDFQKAKERIKARKREEKTIIKTPETVEPEQDQWIILPEKIHGAYSYPDLLVSMETYYRGKNWNQAHKSLSREDEFMLTPRQHADLIKLLQSEKVFYGDGKRICHPARIKQILYDIITPGKWDAEHLDARFENRNGAMWMHYKHKFDRDILHTQNSEPLETCLMEDCYADLLSFNRQGLPTKRSKKQEYVKGENIYYFFPRDGAVAWFVACSDRAYLDCDRDAAGSNTRHGVRRAKIRR